MSRGKAPEFLQVFAEHSLDGKKRKRKKWRARGFWITHLNLGGARRTVSHTLAIFKGGWVADIRFVTCGHHYKKICTSSANVSSGCRGACAQTTTTTVNNFVCVFAGV